jgi:hypothetical protein
MRTEVFVKWEMAFLHFVQDKSITLFRTEVQRTFVSALHLPPEIQTVSSVPRALAWFSNQRKSQ